MHKLDPLMVAAAIVSSAHASASQLESTTQAFLDALAAKGGEPIYTLAVPQARQVLDVDTPRGRTGFHELSWKTPSASSRAAAPRRPRGAPRRGASALLDVVSSRDDDICDFLRL
jgi:hypothetical protein